MAYPTQGRQRLDEVKRLDIGRLKQSGFIEPGKKASGVLDWSERFKVHAQVGIRPLHSGMSGAGAIKLDYTCAGEQITYTVRIVSRPSNLPHHPPIWMFECPATGLLCRKLFFNDRVFVHQSQIDGIYESQAKSKKSRDTDKLLDYLLGPNNIHAQLSQKHLKKSYRGRPTKKYARLLQWEARVGQITHDDITRLMITGSF
jgi:hypothetical protein